MGILETLAVIIGLTVTVVVFIGELNAPRKMPTYYTNKLEG